MLKYLIPFILLGFTACELNEEELLKSIVGTAEEVPEGTYVSQCVFNADDDYSKYVIELSADSYTIQKSNYSNLDCDQDEAAELVSDAIAAELPGPNLGDGFSFFTSGELKVPYFYKDGDFVIGEPQETLPNGEDDFSGFQKDLEDGKIAIYQIQELPE